MKYSHYRISLDIHSTQSQVSLPVKQGDTSRKVLISLCEGGKPYHIEDDCYAVFSAKKPDGSPIENDCKIADNVIEYTFTEQTTAAIGMVNCEVKLYGGDSGLITSASFTLVVYAKEVSDAEVESYPEYLALTNLYTITTTAAANANGKADYAQEQGDYAQSQGDYAKENGDAAATATTNTKMATTKATAATTKANDAATAATEKANEATIAAADAAEQADKARTATDLANAAATNANATAAGIRNSVSNAFKGTASGETLTLTDVSPIEHEMHIKLSEGGKNVTCRGKNILAYPFISSFDTSKGVVLTDNGDGTITANGTASPSLHQKLQEVYVQEGTTYVLSGLPVGTDIYQFAVYAYMDGSQIGSSISGGYAHKITPKTNGILEIRLACYNGSVADNLVFKPQLEVGMVNTEFEPYKKPIARTSDEKGSVSGVTSMYPTTFLATDKEGVTIDVEYNRDANKVIAELIDLIESSGGGSGGASAFVTDVTILANKWVGTSSPYSQVVTVKGATNRSQVDLTPSAEQLAIFHNKDLAFVTENNNGVITVYAIGQKPMNDYTIQATVTEVKA